MGRRSSSGRLVLLLPAGLAGARLGLGVPGGRRLPGRGGVVLTGWVVLQRRTAEPLVRPGMLADRRTIVPNVAGLMTGIALFASFLAVLQYVQAPPDVTGYGFGASVLEASVVYLLPGASPGSWRAARRPAGRRCRARCPPCWPGRPPGWRASCCWPSCADPWSVVLAGLLTQLSVTVAYAALPALVVQAVHEDETGVANAVNSIARSVGQALGSTWRSR